MGQVVISRGIGSPAIPARMEGRLTLSPAHPVYLPQPATPNATDTGADTVSFAAVHGWSTGTIATVSATGGGLTAGTVYYISAVDTDTVSFHTTVADAINSASPVNLTASITAEIRPSGIANKTLYLLQHTGNIVTVYDGVNWVDRGIGSGSGIQLGFSVGAVVAGNNYDVFVYDNAGTLALELGAAWTSATVRSTDLTRQNGVLVSGADTSRRWLGTIRASATDTIEDTVVNIGTSYAKRFLWNAYNQVPVRMTGGSASAHTYNSPTVRFWNNDSTLHMDFVLGQPALIGLSMRASIQAANLGRPRAGLGLDSSTTYADGALTVVEFQEIADAGSAVVLNIVAGLARPMTIEQGFHAVNILESEPLSVASTFTNAFAAMDLLL